MNSLKLPLVHSNLTLESAFKHMKSAGRSESLAK